MKPSDFKLNSDYLTIANVENKAYSITVPLVVMPSSGSYTLSYNLQCKPIKQSITRIYMHHSSWSDANLWGVGTFGVIGWKANGNQDVYENVVISTPNDSTIKVSIELQGSSGITVPTHTIKLRVFRFKVPNVF